MIVDTDPHKECSKCGNMKPLALFCVARLGKMGRAAECNQCRSERYKAARASDPTKHQERSNKWRAANLEKAREIARKSHHKNKDKPENIAKRKTKSRRTSLKNNYGITEAEYQRMFDDQNGRCKCCGIPQHEVTRSLAVDHCHISGKVRGLLCDRCNVGLGLVKDSTTTLANMIKYLTEAR